MDTRVASDPAYRRDLGDGLILRWSTADDAEPLAEFYSQMFRHGPDRPPNQFIAAYTREWMSGHHPLIQPTDVAVVEETSSGAIVAATGLLSQVWEYAGIPFRVGRAENVATAPAYRNRGLVRAVFELIHARSAALGQPVQGVTGLRYFYRQFGYEYALEMFGSRSVAFADVPPLKAPTAEPFGLRDATPADLPLVQSLYDRERAGALVSVRIDEPYWRFMLGGFGAESLEGWRTQLILNDDGRALGTVLIKCYAWHGSITVRGLVVEPGVSLVAAMPTVLRALHAQAVVLPTKPGDAVPGAIRFELGRSHPVYDALGESLAPRYQAPDAWYVRVPDLPAFIRHIAPVLERRLAGSVLAGYHGALELDFYRGGLRLVFKGGKLAAAEDWRPPLWDAEAQGGFPPLVFLQLLFGYRSLAELRYAFPDVWADDEGTRLLRVLFPPQQSWVMLLP